MTPSHKIKKVKAWGAFFCGKLRTWEGMRFGYDIEPTLHAVFTTRREARARSQDTRPVTISYEIPLPNKGKAKRRV